MSIYTDMDRSDLRSQSLDLLRFPLAVAILVVHTFSTDGLTFHGTHISINQMPILLNINYIIDAFIRAQNYPIYFFISGFVFFLNFKPSPKSYLRKFKNRISTLLIPYIIWNTIALLFEFSYKLPYINSYFPNFNSIDYNLSVSAIINTFWNASNGVFYQIHYVCAPENGPLWFLRDLMIAVAFTPVLYYLLKNTGKFTIISLFILYLTQAYFQLGHLNRLIITFFFFSTGAYLSINKKDIFAEFKKVKHLSFILYPLISLTYMVSLYVYPNQDFLITLKSLNTIAGLLFAYNLSAYLLTNNKCKLNRFLASSSFFIYVSHALFCNLIIRLLYSAIHPVSDLAMLSVFVLSVVITLTIIMSTFYLLQRYCPRILKILTGRK